MQTAFYILFIQFNATFKFRTKIPLSPWKTAIAQTLTPLPNGHWPFCVTEVGMDAVPYNTRDSLLMWEFTVIHEY